jgi:enterochelin esterase family protein
MPGRVEVHAFESRLLVGNALGDSPRRRVPVYLPPGLDRPGAPRVPVLFALAGFTGSGLSYLNYDFYQPNLPERLDRLIESGAMPPAVVVMVDGMTRLGGNQYVDSSAVGPWARHVCEELVPWAEQSFHVLPGRDHRGVFGKSSGGYGAWMMALEHADVFAGAVSHSGDAYFEYCYAVHFPSTVDTLRAAGGLDGYLARLPTFPKLPRAWGDALIVVAQAAFYGPNPAAPHGFDLPFDLETGERREDVLARWRERDPVHLVERHAQALASLRLLWFDCGTRDEWNLHHGARMLARRLAAVGVPHVHEEFDDDHKQVGYRHDVSLPRLARALL